MMRLFGKPSGSGKIPVMQNRLGIEPGNLKQLFSVCAGKSVANQLAMGELVVKGRDWSVDFSRQEISFGNSRFPMKLIGSESDQDDTWLWGWGNQNPLPPQVLSDVRKIRQIGEQHQYRELAEAMLPVDETVNGHALSIISAALHEEPVCYYRCPYSGGAAFVFVNGLPAKVYDPLPAVPFINKSMMIVGKYELDHALFMKSFLIQNNCEYEDNSDGIIARFPGREKLSVKFDDLGRISSMQVI